VSVGGPLAGVRVLDLSRLLPGGFCSLLLADFGAEVLKVEDTGMGDYVRWAEPRYEGAQRSASSALFLALNRGKRSIRINLREEGGREVLLRLAREYDVLLESFRPGVLDRLGVGYERLREENPGLVYCAVTGYGQDGPYRDRAGHDMNYLGLVGLLGLTGEPDRPPVQAAGQIADLGGGALMGAFGILAALRERERSGEGQLVDVSMADGAMSWLALVAARYLCDGQVPGRGRLELAGGLVCYRPYACSDGHVTLGALEPKFWQAWCRGVDREDLIERQFDPPGSETHAEVERIFAGRTRAEWESFAAEHDCCLEPVLGLDEALGSELTRAREMVVEVDQPGAGPVSLLGLPVKLGRTPGGPAGPGPALGEHTDVVLEEAGYSEQEREELRSSGAVAGPVEEASGSFSADPAELVFSLSGPGRAGVMPEQSDDTIRAFVEIPKGSRNKYEWHEESGTIELDRRLFAAVSYPTDYGFIPETLAEDGDELDIMIAVSEPTFPGCTIRVQPIAVLKMHDDDKRNDKVLAVPVSDPAWSKLDELDDLPGDLADEVSHFFEVYSDLEGTDWQIEGWGSSHDAHELIEQSRERYRESND